MRTLLGLAAIGFAAASTANERPRPTFSENLTVVERTVWVDDSLLPKLGSLFRRSAGDFVVRIDGAAVELADLPIEEPAEVAHLVWFDPDLASPTSFRAAAAVLAAAFGTFPEGERFSIVEFGSPWPDVRTNLSRAAAVARLTEASRESRTERPSPPDFDRRAAALDRLAVEIGKYDARDLGALWLVAEPWPFEQKDVDVLSRVDEADPLGHSTSGALARASRIPASAGWTIFPVAARDGQAKAVSAPELHVPGADRPGARESSPRFDLPNPGIIRLIFFGVGDEPPPPSPSVVRAVDLAMDARLAPMAALARETAGSLVGNLDRIERLAERLRERRRLVVREADVPRDRARRIEVSWFGGDGRLLPSLRWIGPRAPRELAAARLSTVLDSGLERSGAPLRIRRVMDSDGEVGESLCFAYPRVRTELRLSFWRSGRDAFEVEPTVAPSSEGPPCVSLPSTIEGADLVALEVPDSGEWGASRVAALAPFSGY